MIKSIGTLKNMIQESDRSTEMPILLKQASFLGGQEEQEQESSMLKNVIRANLDSRNLINEAIDLIEED